MRDYFESAVERLDVDTILEQPVGTSPVRPIQTRQPRRGMPRWIYDASAAVVVLIALIGGLGWLAATPQVEPPQQPTTTIPVTFSTPVTVTTTQPAVTNPPQEVTLRVADVVDLGANPSSDLVPTAGAVWVAVESGSGSEILRIDAANRAVTDTIPIEGLVSVLVPSGDAVWALVEDTGTVARIDVGLREVTGQIQVPRHVSADGWSVIADGALWIGHTTGLVRVDLESATVTDTLAEGSPANWVGEAAGAVWWYDSLRWRDKRLSRFDLSTGQLEVYDVACCGAFPSEEGAIVVDDELWLIHDTGRVGRFGLESRSLIDQFHVGYSIRDGVYASGAVWLPAVGKSTSLSTLLRIDVPSNELIDEIELHDMTGIVAHEGALWITGLGRLSHIDAQTGQVTGAMDLPGGVGVPLILGGEVWLPSPGAVSVIEMVP